MKKYLSYLRRLLMHKWFVLLAGRRVGVPLWRLIVHDWSKFMPVEFLPYARYDFAVMREDLAFDTAWLHHQKHNPHHWQYWVLIQDFKPTKALPMPTPFVREMVADWMGAGRAYTGSWDMSDWLRKSLPHMTGFMHPNTITRLGFVLVEQGYLELWQELVWAGALQPLFPRGLTEAGG